MLTITSSSKAALAGMILLFSAPAFAQTQAQNPPPNLTAKAKHGDWELICGKAGPEAAEECFMAQGVNSRQTGQTVLAAMVMKPKDREPVLRMTVPLGVLLPRGLAFTIDGREIGGVGFLYCLADGCVTQVTLNDDVLGQLKAGNEAVAMVHRLNDQTVRMPLSLTGFTAAYNAF